MTLDMALASVVVATIAASGAVVNTIIAAGQGRKLDETHKQVTVNHHSSQTPTVLDRIDDVRQEVLLVSSTLTAMCSEVNRLHSDFNAHVAHSNEMDIRLIEIEGGAKRD